MKLSVLYNQSSIDALANKIAHDTVMFPRLFGALSLTRRREIPS